jgi:hypothetical protein
MAFDLIEWLENNGLGRYAPAFIKNDIDRDLLPSLDDQDLIALGVSSLGHRKRLLAAIGKLDQGEVDRPAESMLAKRGRVFISYGHDPACQGLVDRIHRDLRNHGYEVWLDRERIEFGDDWRREITDGIAASQHVLAFLSAHSTRKPGVCRQEIAIALGPLRGHVYTVLVEPLSVVNPPLIVSHLQWLDMHNWHRLLSSAPEEFENWYRQRLDQILEVLDDNTGFGGEIDELSAWLQPVDSTADLIASEAGFQGRGWLLDGLGESEGLGEIEQWRTSKAAQRVLWLSAEPGWGKSAVAARLAHAGRSRVLAVHFCRHDLPARRDAGSVIRSIAFQIATQLADYRSLLLERCGTGMDLAPMNPTELFHALMVEPSIHLIEGDRRHDDRRLIVIDALDETLQADGSSELLDLLSVEFAKMPRWIGLVVTSRPEAPIVRRLAHYGVRTLKADDPRNLNDIAEFAHRFLAGTDLDPAGQLFALANITRAAAGNFLYVRQIVRSVAEGVIPVQELCHESRMPAGLANLYHHWFERRFPDRSRYRDDLVPVMELLAAAIEPIPLSLISHLLRKSLSECESLIEPMGSLIAREEDQLGFFHKSLHDWMTDRVRCGATWHADRAKGDLRFCEALQDLDSCNGQALRYLLRHGATHAARAERPEIGARHLSEHARPRYLAGFVSNAGTQQLAIDDYLGELRRQEPHPAHRRINPSDLAVLLARTDSGASETACDLVMESGADLHQTFLSSPLDGRGATWVFASRWAWSILSDDEHRAASRWREAGRVAIDPDHPLYLPAAYAFKYVATQRVDWVSLESLEPICRSWTYSRLVASNLLMQLTLNGSTIATRIPWPEYWEPVWDYNRIEIDLLIAAMTWRGLPTRRPCPADVLKTFVELEKERCRLLQITEDPQLRESLELFWHAAGDPSKTRRRLQASGSTGEGRQVLMLHLSAPMFEIAEVAADILSLRAKGDRTTLEHLVIQACSDEPTPGAHLTP